MKTISKQALYIAVKKAWEEANTDGETLAGNIMLDVQDAKVWMQVFEEYDPNIYPIDRKTYPESWRLLDFGAIMEWEELGVTKEMSIYSYVDRAIFLLIDAGWTITD